MSPRIIGFLLWLTVLVTVLNAKNFREERVSLPSSTDGCLCEGGALPYEDIALANTGAGCIGGCGGSPFEFHANGTTVKTITVWPGCGAHDSLRGIKITLFNGDSKLFGEDVCSSSDTFTFVPGERLVGELILTGDGIGTRTGYIEFKTSNGRTFKSGHPHDLYHFNVESGYLTGFFGRSGDDIDHLGIYVIKPIETTALRNIVYPTLSSLETGTNPVVVANYKICNDETIKQSYQEQFTKTVGTDHCWTLTEGFSFENDFSVTAGIPEVESVKDEFKWTVSATTSYNSCVHKTSQTDADVIIVAEPRYITKVVYTQWASKVNLPFVATFYLHLKNGKIYTFNTKGVYEGIYVTSVNESIDGTPLKKGEKCPTKLEIV